MTEACGVWLSDDGPCGQASVERLHFLHEWSDHPGPVLGLALCAEHLNEYTAAQLLAVAG